MAPHAGKVLGLNSISLLIHCSASGHRLQGRKKNRQLSRFMHISNRSRKVIYKQSHRNRLSAHSLENIRAEELNPTKSACASLIQLSSNFTSQTSTADKTFIHPKSVHAQNMNRRLCRIITAGTADESTIIREETPFSVCNSEMSPNRVQLIVM